MFLLLDVVSHNSFLLFIISEKSGEELLKTINRIFYRSIFVVKLVLYEVHEIYKKELIKMLGNIRYRYN